MRTSFLTPFLAVIPLTTAGSSKHSKTSTSKKVLLSNIDTLTLHAGRLTSHRRIPAIPQLKCINDPVCNLHQVETIRCRNQGSSYSESDVQWTCTAELPPEFKLGSTEVLCEGYESPEDNYILKGSCGVEYRLLFTEAGEKKYREWLRDRKLKEPESGQANDSAGAIIFMVLFIGTLLWILYTAFRTARTPVEDRRRQRPRVDWNGGGGGGEGGDDDPPDNNNDPPPPYTGDYYPSSQPKSTPAKGATQTGTNMTPSGGSSSSSAQNTQPDPWRRGFYTGIAAGTTAAAAAGYAASRLRAQDRDPDSESETDFEEQSRDAQEAEDAEIARRNGVRSSGPMSWQRRPGRGSGNGEGDSSSSSYSHSSDRYESTGFGGTSRR
jgi:hypothetical protein